MLVLRIRNKCLSALSLGRFFCCHAPVRLDDNVLDVSEDYCRVMVTLDLMGKLD